MSRLGVVLPVLTLVLSGGIAWAAAGEATDVSAPGRAERRLDTVGPIDTVVAISIDGLNPKAISKLGTVGRPRSTADRTGATHAQRAHRARAHRHSAQPHRHGHRAPHRGRHRRPRGDVERRPPHAPAPSRPRPASGLVVFNVVHDAGGCAAFFASKTKFSLWDALLAATRSTRDVIVEDNQALVATFMRDLAARPRLPLPAPLGARTSPATPSGFMGPAYLTAVRRADRLVGRSCGRSASSTPAAPATPRSS